jgi:hypothetical protein
MITPKMPKQGRSGFREFIKQRRLTQLSSPSNPAELFEIRLPPSIDVAAEPDTRPATRIVTLRCGEGVEQGDIEGVRLDALVGCSRWFYELFLSGTPSECRRPRLMTSIHIHSNPEGLLRAGRKDNWSDNQRDTIFLPSLTLEVAQAIVDFATMEERVNPTCSFLVKPPNLENWALTEDLLGRNRTVFQFGVRPEIALDLCHAALFLEIPALVDVSCRMLGYFIDFLPTIDGMDSELVRKILSHVSPLKLAILENLPQYAPYVSELTPVWEEHCIRSGLEYREMEVPRSWYRYDRLIGSTPTSDTYSPRELFIHTALRKDLGQLATEFKLQKRIENLRRESGVELELSLNPVRNSVWQLDSDGVWKREPTVIEQKTIMEATSASSCLVGLPENEDGTKFVRPLGDLHLLQQHIRSISLHFPLDTMAISALKHLETLEIREAALWHQLPGVLSQLESLRHLIIDAVVVSGVRLLPEAIFNAHDLSRHHFKVPPEWKPEDLTFDPNITEASLQVHSRASASLFAALELFQISTQLPHLETFQFSAIEWEGISPNNAWDWALAPHWRSKQSKIFYPSLKSLSLCNSRISARALNAVFYIFRDVPLELLDIGGGLSLGCDVNWNRFSNWVTLKHLLLSCNNVHGIRSAITALDVGKSLPPSLETLGFDHSSPGFALHELLAGLCINTLPNFQALYFNNSHYGTHIIESLSSLSHSLCTNLRVLDLSNCRLNDRSLGQLESIIQDIPNLQELRIASNLITEEGSRRLLSFMNAEERQHVIVAWGDRRPTLARPRNLMLR